MNEEPLAAFLRARYAGVEVNVVDFKSLTNPVDEAYAMSNATIFITPMGGGSFDANIMQDNAVVIFTAPCANGGGGKVNCFVIPREVSTWNHVTHIHKVRSLGLRGGFGHIHTHTRARACSYTSDQHAHTHKLTRLLTPYHTFSTIS
jgi:hypothetical protein